MYLMNEKEIFKAGVWTQREIYDYLNQYILFIKISLKKK